MISVFFGQWANQANQEELRVQWEQGHFPSQTIIQTALASYRMARVTQLSMDQKMNSLILSADEQLLSVQKAFWASPDLSWIVYDWDGNGVELQVFHRGEGAHHLKSPDSLKLIGAGWNGLEQLLVQLEKKGIPAQSLNLKKKKTWRDVREVVY